eukprot:4524491-Alexandrium_andersonii.AAC.1
MHTTEAVRDGLALRKARSLGSKDGGPAAGAGGVGGGWGGNKLSSTSRGKPLVRPNLVRRNGVFLDHDSVERA